MARRRTDPLSWTPERVALGGRAGVALLTLALVVIDDDRLSDIRWWVLVTALSALSWIVGSTVRGSLVPGLTAGRTLRILEAGGIVAAVTQTGLVDSPLLPALLAPAFAGGVSEPWAGAVVSPGFASIGFLVAALTLHHPHSFDAAAAEWVLLSVATGGVGALLRRLTQPRAESDAAYAAAYRLLAQLRPVARRLSVGLDPVTIATGLLEALRALVPFDSGVVLVVTSGNRLVPLATVGASSLAADSVGLDADHPVAEAWLTQRTSRIGTTLSGGSGAAAVIPLVIGLRSFGVVGVEAQRGAVLDDVTGAAAQELVAETAMRLETALLFDELRSVATAEERRRVAREIHDGIAQELTSLGYVIDDIAADASGGDQQVVPERLRELRSEVSRIISELRLSIFDLRSDVDTHGGLGAALSEYVRAVGRQSGLTVHLSLAEAGSRLPTETEAELLRIGQEAVTNARRHAGADNLWVSLEVQPPYALLRVEDDGRGLGTPREDSYGLHIMRERAERLRADLVVRDREPTGTMVEVTLHTPALAGSRPAAGATGGPR